MDGEQSVRGVVWRLLAAIDRRFRKHLPDHQNVPITLAANWRDAGSLRMLILFQGVVYWACTVLTPLSAPDYDVFFHLAHGRYQDLNGRLPTDAYFSFLEPRVFVDYYWLYQRLIWELWQAAGPYALMALRGALATLAFGLLGLFLFGHRRSGAVLLSSMLVFALVGSRLVFVLGVSRPYVFSYICLLAMLWILEMRSRWVPLLPWIGLVWLNFHGVEHPVLLAVVLAYSGDEVLAWIRRGELGAAGRQRLFWLLATLPTLLLTPHGLALVVFPFKSTALASLYIGEMQKPTWASLPNIAFGPNMEIPLYGGAVILFVLAAVAVVRRLQRRTLRPVHLVLLATGTYLAFQGNRFIVEFMLLGLPLLAGGTLVERRAARPLLSALVVTALSGLLVFDVAGTWVKQSRSAYPVAFNAFSYGVSSFLLKVAPPGGRVLNSAGYGGLLLFELGERHQVMMDLEVQAIFRDDDFFLNRTALLFPKAFENFTARYHPDYLAIEHTEGQQATFLHDSPNFVPVSFDDSLVLLVDRRRHPELAAEWGLSALDPWRAKLDNDYVLSPAAVVEAERLYRLEKRGVRLPALLAQAAIGRGDLEAAEGYLDTLIAVSPDNADGYSLLSALLLQRGDQEGAAAALRKALRRTTPQNAGRLRRPLAHLLTRQGDGQGAIEELRLSGNFFDPMPLDDLELWVALLEKHGDPEEAAAARGFLTLRRGEPGKMRGH